MGKLSEKDVEELREFFSLGCEYSGTEEVVSEIVCETLEEMDGSGMKTEVRNADEIGLTDGEEFATLDDFVRIFWEKAVEKILNVVETSNIVVAESGKQISKKPVVYKSTNRADCPVCGATVRGTKEPFGDWCSKCGQKLDWE